MRTASPKKRSLIVRFFRLLWRCVKAINTLIFSLLSVLLIAAILYALFQQRGPDIPVGGALVMNPVGSLVDQETALAASSVLQGNELPQQTLVRDLVDALALARDDDRIKMLVLDLDRLEYSSLSSLERVAGAVDDFKSGGKQVIAMANNYNQSALYLAVQADEVLLNPEGMAVPEGFSMYGQYFRSFLDKHEVSVNLFKVGKYKSAVDPFLRDDMSEEDRTARKAILDGWWAAYTSHVETARGMEAGSIDAMLNAAPETVRQADGNLAKLALDKGLVDRLMNDPQRLQYLIDRVGEDEENSNSYRGVGYQTYLQAAPWPVQSDAGTVAVITAVGAIVDGHAPAGSIGSQSLIERIRQAREDKSVKALVLRINSPGGSKSASEMIRVELQAIQDAGIPVVASMGAVAASGGYWIASSADQIWSTPTTITGSIGIFGLMPSIEKTLARQGIFSDGIATTPIAGGASLTRGITPEYHDVLQTVVDAGYQQFLNTVADGRNMDVEAVHEVAQGRIWLGETARDIGLVDELGDLDKAVEAAARLAKMDDYAVWHVEPELSLEEQLLRRLSEVGVVLSPSISNNPVAGFINRVRDEFGFLEQLNDPSHVYVICGECWELR